MAAFNGKQIEAVTDESGNVTYQMSYVHQPRRQTLEKRTVLEFVCLWSEVKPEEEAFVFLSNSGGREVVTWKELYDNSIKYAKALVSLGLKELDVIAIALPDCPKWLYLAFGAMFARAIPVGIQFRLKDGSDVLSLMKTIATCSTFVLDTDYNQTAWNIFKTFLSSYSRDGRATSHAIPSLRYVLSTSSNNSRTEILTIDELLLRPQHDTPLPKVFPEDIVGLFQTSGSTSTPKIVAHTHLSFTAIPRDRQYSKDNNSARMVVYNEMIFNWIGGCPMGVVSGHTRVLLSGFAERPTNHADFIIAAIKQEGCSMLRTIPPMLQDIMDSMATQKTSEAEKLVRFIGVGGQPVRKQLASCVGTICDVLRICYSTTEAIAILSKFVETVDDFDDNNCGTVMEGYEVKIVDESGDLVPVRMRGELYVRGPTMFSGYYNDQEKTTEAMTDDGWYKTGDLGFMKEDGQFFVEGRKSDTIICNAVTIIPRDLEVILKSMPGIRDAVVVPIPDEKMFQAPCACVIVHPGSEVTEEMLRTHFADLINDFDQVHSVLPRYYLFFDRFPKTVTGKTNRKDVMREALSRLE